MRFRHGHELPIGRNFAEPTCNLISPVAIFVENVVRTPEMEWTIQTSLVRFLATGSLNNKALNPALLFDSVRHKLDFSHANLPKSRVRAYTKDTKSKTALAGGFA